MALASTAFAAADGAAIFKAKCAMCHGADGSASTGMGKSMGLKALGSPEVQKTSDADMTALVTNGKGKMPGFKGKLSDEEISAVVKYVQHPQVVVRRSGPTELIALVGVKVTRTSVKRSCWIVATCFVAPDDCGGRPEGCDQSREDEQRGVSGLSQRPHVWPKTRTGSRSACMWTTRSSRLPSTAPSVAPTATPTSRRFLTIPRQPSRFAPPATPTSRRPTSTASTPRRQRRAIANVAKCQDCHGNVHEILPASDPKSKVAHANIPATCGACHGKQLVMASSGVSSAPFNSYEQSVHGKAVTGGSEYAAVCTDCHGAHDILTGADPKSPIAKFNVPATCGKCHADVQAAITCRASTARRLRAATGSRRCVPTATAFTPSRRRTIPTRRWRQAMSATTCGSCHASVKLSVEFGVAGNRVSSLPLELSRHGVEGRLGDGGQLRQLPRRAQHSAFQRSALDDQPRNLAKTCGQCHPGANDEVHYQQGSPGRYAARPTSARKVIALHQQVLRLDDRRGDRRDGAAQPPGLPQETEAAPHRASADPVPHDTWRSAPST